MDDNTTKWILVGIAGYFLWEYLSPSVATAAVAPAGSALPASSVPASAVPVATSAAPLTPAQHTLAVLQQMGPQPVLLAARNGLNGNIPLPASGLFEPDQWNFYMSTVSGIPSPVLAAYVGTSNTPITIAQYWTALMQWASDQATGAQAPAPVASQTVAMSGLNGLGQPGRSTQNHFAAPGSNETGRYDLQEMGW